jgi:RNA polymerase sigma-70 factor (ECF subfamily)
MFNVRRSAEGPAVRPHWRPGIAALVSAMSRYRDEKTGVRPFADSEANHLKTAERNARMNHAQSEAAVDRGLIRRFNGGEEAAFTEIVGRHRERIQSLAIGFLRNHADAEEVTQDTFIRAHRGLARFRGDSSLATWLHRIAFNLARNRYWYFFRRRRHLTYSLDCPLNPETNGTFSDLMASGEPTPARHAIADEFVAIVAVCMQQIDAPHREILILRNELHRTYEEIAVALGINEGTVKSRIARARQKLRQTMAGACPEFSNATDARDWLETARSSSADLAVVV